MSYCALDDLKGLLDEQKIIQLTDDEGMEPPRIDALNADCAMIISRTEKAIDAADAEIDGYVAVRYGVPLNPVPALVKSLSVDITIYNLYRRRTVPEVIDKLYERAVAKLKDISKGLLTLGIDPPAAASTAADSAATNLPGNRRVFTRDKLRGF